MKKKASTAPQSGHLRTALAGTDAVVLAGSLRHERASNRGVPRSLLPLPTSTLIEQVLDKLLFAGCPSCVICTNGSTDLITRRIGLNVARSGRVEVYADLIPRGTAGCLKACESRFNGDNILVIGGAVWLEDDPVWMLDRHRESGNAITVFCTGPSRAGMAGQQRLQPAGLYVLNRSVLGLVPQDSFFDLKEQLIPAAQRAGLSVGAIVLPQQSHEVINWPAYLGVLEKSIDSLVPDETDFRELAPGIWQDQGVKIAESARLVGPVVLGRRCVLEENALVIGPAFLADDTHVGASACLVRVVAGRATRFSRGTVVTDRLVGLSSWLVAKMERSPITAGSSPARASEADSAWPRHSRRPFRVLAQPVLAGAALLSLFVWAFWHTFENLLRSYQENAEAGVGGLVPLASAYMLATTRGRLLRFPSSLAWSGLAVFALGLGLNLFGVYYLYASISNLGMVVCANGLALALLGWEGYKRSWYPLVFLLVMCPLPGRVQDGMMLPLQTVGSVFAAVILETIGMPVERSGHIFDLGGQTIAVAEACNGLRMVTASLLVAGVLAYVIQGPGWRRVALVLSSIPIALICNVARITLTAVLYNAGYPRIAEGLFHDLAGLLMMPIMVGLLLLELRLLSRIRDNILGRRSGDGIGDALRGRVLGVAG